MQRIQIDIYISDLLYRYDCVVIPEFGGFVANYASAKIQAVQHKIVPPSKQLSFNKNLKTNDGLLSKHIAERRSISYEEANEFIRSFVNQSIEGLNKGDKIRIEKVGVLHLDPERNIQFTAEEQNDYLLDSFGLGALRVQPIKREGAKERIEEQIQKVIPFSDDQEKKKKRAYWPAAAMLILLLVAAFIFNTQFNWVGNDGINYSSFELNSSAVASYDSRSLELDVPEFEEEEPRKMEFAAGIVPYSISDEEPTNLFVDNRKSETKLKLDNTSVATSSAPQKLRYHVMGGCFSNKENAETLVSELINRGFDARLLGTYKNLHAVSFGSFEGQKEARKLLSKVKKTENSAAWLLVKPF